MATNNPTWEKTPELAAKLNSRFGQRQMYMLIGGIGIIGIIAYLIYGTLFGGAYFKTVDELVNDPDMIGKNVRISGVVIGEYQFDSSTQTLTFVVGNIPNDNDTIKEQGGLSQVLYKGANDPNVTKLTVVYHNGEIPDLLKHEAQAILSGKLGEDGIFYADSLQLKCPTRYEDETPDQVAENQ